MPTTVSSGAAREGVVTGDFLGFWDRVKTEPTYVILGVQGSGTNLLCRLLKHCFGISTVRDRSLIIGTATSLVGNSSPTSIERALRHVHKCLFPTRLQRRMLPRRYYRQGHEFEGVEKYFKQASITSPGELTNFFILINASLLVARRAP